MLPLQGTREREYHISPEEKGNGNKLKINKNVKRNLKNSIAGSETSLLAMVSVYWLVGLSVIMHFHALIVLILF